MKYRIIRSFPYYGEDGKKKPPVTISPGEKCPKLDSSAKEALLTGGYICAIDDNDENILQSKKSLKMSETEIENFIKRDLRAIKTDINRIQMDYKIDPETKAKLMITAEKLKCPQPVIDALEEIN